MKKRWIALLLSMIMVLSLLAACGGQEAGKTPNEPNAPVEPNTPDTPDKPDTPDTPDATGTVQGVTEDKILIGNTAATTYNA